MLSFPPFRLDLDSERLWRHDEELHLRRKPFAILRYLVQNPQRLVTHGEIVESVWGKIAMSESLLRTHVRDLRQVLGAGIVETVVGRGYRFTANLNHVAADYARDGVDDGEHLEGRFLVGRDDELDSLRAALSTVSERRRTAVFVTGEAGIGKTTLVDHFLDLTSARMPILVGRGACIEHHGSGQAYLPALDMVGALCRGRGGERATDILSKYAPTWLSQLPGIVRSDRLETLQRRAAGATRARMLRELAEALEALSVDVPVVLVFEDMHWIDASTAELLAILCRRREPARFLVVGTYRPAEMVQGHPLSRVVGELVAHRLASAVELYDFDGDDLDGYLAKRFRGHRFSAELATTLLHSTGGNPMLLTTLTDELEAQGVLRCGDDGWLLTASVEEVAAHRPDGVLRMIDAQVARLGTIEQQIIEAASIVGMTFTTGLVAYALDADPDAIDSCCETLANKRKLLRYLGTETWPDGTLQSRYAFGQALFRHAALGRAQSVTIRHLHRRIAERLRAGT